MANEIVNLKPLQTPGEVLDQEDNGSKFEIYKPDGVYEYPILPSGHPNKSRVKITYNHGDIYDGTLRRGKPNGEGKYSWQGGGIYEGGFEKGKLSGNGKYVAGNGDVFEGSFKDNKYHGDGKYTWADGSSFEGNFKDGMILNGRYTDASGNVYICKFTYKRNGERKSGNIRLIKFAEKKNAHTEKKKTETKTRTKTTNKDGLLSKDVKLIAAIKKSKRGAEFKNFYSGAAGKTEKAEKGLIAILNFFSNSDAEQIARIFKTSAIYDKTKGDEHVTDMISGVIKRSKDFTSSMKAATKTKQKGNSANKGAAK